MLTNKMHRFKNKLFILLIITLLTSLFFNYLYYKEREKYEYKFSTFLNHLYFSTDHSLKVLNAILDEENLSNQLDREFVRLSESLKEIHHLLNESLFYLDLMPSNNWIFQEVYDLINYGFKYNDLRISPFLEDNKIDKSERAYLLELKAILSNMNEKMYSEETGQENPNINKYLFKEIIQSGDQDVLFKKYLDNLDKK